MPTLLSVNFLFMPTPADCHWYAQVIDKAITNRLDRMIMTLSAKDFDAVQRNIDAGSRMDAPVRTGPSFFP